MTLERPAAPPTKADLLEVFRSTTPRDYHEPIAAHESYALFRAIASSLAAAGRKGARSIQARYYLPHSLQADAPASGAAPASGMVTIERRAALDHGLTFAPGAVRFEALGRTYVNAAAVRWNPGDTLARDVAIVCENPGFHGNLDHLADADGMLDIEHIAFADQSHDRAGTGATIAVGAQTIVQDRGIPDLFAPEDVGLYLRCSASSVAANVGTVRRIVGFAWPEVEVPIGSGRFPRQVMLDDLVLRNPGEVLTDDGGVFTDRYAAAVSETAGDLPLLPTPLTVGDALYLGYPRPFSRVEVEVTTAGSFVGTVAWEYWAGAAWVEIPAVEDPATGWRPSAAGVVEVRWAPPADWATLASPGATGLTLYYVRARLSSLTSSTTAPVGGRLVLHVPEPLAADAGTAQWRLLDAADLELEITDCEAPSDGRDDDLWILGDERAIYRQPGESEEDFRQRAARVGDAVSPNAVLRTVNRALAPYNYRGAAMDVGNGLTGLFLDVPSDTTGIYGALDMYESGDVYPVDPWQLLLDLQEAHGWFAVLLPYLGAGEFGASLTDSPLVAEGSGWSSGAADSAFLDGYPVAALGVYGSIHSQIDKVRLGGVRFDLLRDAAIEPDTC